MKKLTALSLLICAGMLSACDSNPFFSQKNLENWDNVYEKRQPQVSFDHHRHVVAFPYGRTSPDANEWSALESFLSRLQPAGGDRILIETVDLQDAVLERREDVVAAYIEHLGFDVQVVPVKSATEATSLSELTISVRKAIVSVPRCPDWSGDPSSTSNNQPSSNFGCADAVNFSLMIADPNDLIRGRTMGPADAEYMTGSIQRYRARETEPFVGDSGGAAIEISDESGGDGGGE